MQEKVPVKLELHGSFFDLFMAVLENSAAENCIERARKEAEQLFHSCMKYSRAFVDSDGKECVRMFLYDQEAAGLIWQLLLCVADHVECELLHGYSKELECQRSPNDRR